MSTVLVSLRDDAVRLVQVSAGVGRGTDVALIVEGDGSRFLTLGEAFELSCGLVWWVWFENAARINAGLYPEREEDDMRVLTLADVQSGETMAHAVKHSLIASEGDYHAVFDLGCRDIAQMTDESGQPFGFERRLQLTLQFAEILRAAWTPSEERGIPDPNDK